MQLNLDFFLSEGPTPERFLIAGGDSLFIWGHPVRQIHQSSRKNRKYYLISCHFTNAFWSMLLVGARVNRPFGVRVDR